MEKRIARVMARSEEDQNRIYQKIVHLNRREGFSWKQATAIALRMYRDGELRGTTVQKRKEIPKPKKPITETPLTTKTKKDTTSRGALVALILKQAVEHVGNNKERFIQAVSTITLQPIEIIQQKYTEGEERWKVFHLPGVTIEQAARDNVYDYILNG
jgi:hypothetical protein